MEIWVVCSCLLLQITLLWAFLYMSFGVYTYAILWGLYLDSKHAYVWVRYFWYFPKCLYQLILPPALYQSFSGLTLGILCSFPFNSGSAVISNWVLIGISMITHKSWVPFICLLTIWISSLWSACPSFLLSFSIVLLKISNGFKGSYFFFFHFFWLWVLCWEHILQYPFPDCAFLLHSHNGVFWRITLIFKMYSDLSFFLWLAFSASYLIHLYLPNVNYVIVFFFPKSLLFLPFTTRSKPHLRLIFFFFL